MGSRIVMAVGVAGIALAEAALAQPRIEGDPAVLRVLVMNPDGSALSPDTLRHAETEAAHTFASAGVRLVWRESSLTGVDFDVVVRVVSGMRLDGLSSGDAEATWGFAVTEKHVAGLRGRVVYVRADQIERYAADHAVSVAQLCGVVMAHEIGHLLLPAGHSTSGLMRATLRPESLTGMYFTRPQVQAMHARMAVVNAARAGAGLLSRPVE